MDSLPKEILVHVLHFLSFKDLKSCRLVSKRFLEAATERSLWKHFVLGITRSNLSKLNKIFQLEIMKDLRNVNITGCSIKTEHVKLLIDNDITSLHLGYNNDVENDCRIDKVSVKSLATLVTKFRIDKVSVKSLATPGPQYRSDKSRKPRKTGFPLKMLRERPGY